MVPRSAIAKVIAVLAVLVLAYGMYAIFVVEDPNALTRTERSELSDRLVKADDLMTAKKKAWDEATARKVLDSLEPTDVPCKTLPPPISQENAASYIRDNLNVGAFGWRFALIRKPGESPAEPWFASMKKTLEPTRAASANDKATKEDLRFVREVADPTVINGHRALVVLAKAEKLSLVHVENDPPTYEPGGIHARVFLFSYGDEKITCVGDIEAENSPSMDIRYFSQPNVDIAARLKASRAALGRDLEVQLDRAARAALREVKR